MHEMVGYEVCPFYQYEKKNATGEYVLMCENLKVRFKNKKSRRRFLYGYCAHGGFFEGKECTWHAELRKCYENAE